MSGASLTRPRTSGKFPGLRNWSQRSEAERFRHVWSSRRSLSLKPVPGPCGHDCGKYGRPAAFWAVREPTTLKELSAALGKETIDTYNTGESRGRETSHTLNYQKLGKELASVDELAVLDGGKCILQLRGVRPFLSDKYDITKHPNYKYLSDSDKRNAFDIERFLSVRLKPKAEEVYDVYEVDLTDEEAATA